MSDVIPVLRLTPIGTQPSAVSVFLSVAKCGRVCRAQTYAHSGIEQSTLAKGFLQGGPKEKFEIFFKFLTISSLYDSYSNEKFISPFFHRPNATNPQKGRRQSTPACKLWRESTRGCREIVDRTKKHTVKQVRQ